MCELTTAGVRPPGQLDGRTPRPDQTHQDEVADSVVSAIHLVKETDRSKRWLGRDRLSTEEYGMSTALSHWLLNGYGNKGSEMFDWSNMENEVVTDEAAESDHYWFSILKVRKYVRKQSFLHWITWGFSLTILVFILVFNIMFSGTCTSLGESSTIILC